MKLFIRKGKRMMNNIDIFVDICQIVTAIVAVAGFILYVFVYKNTLNRERRLDTLRTLSELRVKYPNTEKMSEEESFEYIKALEFFATGVNQEIYDIKIVKKMSGNRLVKQYNENLKDLIGKKRHKKDAKKKDSEAYIEYEKMIQNLKEMKR